LKKAKEAENENFYIGVGNHPEEAVDAEVVRIVNENLADPDGHKMHIFITNIPTFHSR
jgi:hypothetical protein